MKTKYLLVGIGSLFFSVFTVLYVFLVFVTNNVAVFYFLVINIDIGILLIGIGCLKIYNQQKSYLLRGIFIFSLISGSYNLILLFLRQKLFIIPTYMNYFILFLSDVLLSVFFILLGTILITQRQNLKYPKLALGSGLATLSYCCIYFFYAIAIYIANLNYLSAMMNSATLDIILIMNPKYAYDWDYILWADFVMILSFFLVISLDSTSSLIISSLFFAYLPLASAMARNGILFFIEFRKENDQSVTIKKDQSLVKLVKEPTSEVKIEKPIGLAGIGVKRGGEVQGGRYIYKIKLENNSQYNIMNINFQIISYPQESIILMGNKFREISKLDPGGIVSPTFEFQPTRDCITGIIHSAVTFIDLFNNPHTIHVQPHKISIVCGLLKPKSIDINEFTKICEDLLNYEKVGEEINIPYNPKLIFEKLKVLLPEQNFMFVTRPETKILGDTFFGEINGFAEGKFNKKCVGIKITITGKTGENNSIGMIEGFAQDQAMLPSLISELSEKIIHWNCKKCNGPLDKDDVEKLLQNKVINCKYCGISITKLSV
ncbi:MAG: hypothetical protein ACTSR3_08220 [Candidatus Helarchaeota archaeon]